MSCFPPPNASTACLYREYKGRVADEITPTPNAGETQSRFRTARCRHLYMASHHDRLALFLSDLHRVPTGHLVDAARHS